MCRPFQPGRRKRCSAGWRASAQDLLILEDTLEFLADRTASVHAGALPGDWDADAGRYTLTEDSRAAVQALFNVSPTDGQLSSASEP